MNIDFGQHPGFSIYVVLLMGTGIAMMLLTCVGRAGGGLRLLNGLFGLGFFGYGFYLAFLFEGGSYFIFFKAFILPVVLVFRTVHSAVTKGGATAQQAAPVAPAGPGAPVLPGAPVAPIAPAPFTPQGAPIRPE